MTDARDRSAPDPEPGVPTALPDAPASDTTGPAPVGAHTTEPVAAAVAADVVVPLISTRQLLGASFDLLTRTQTDMRRASFYVGVIVLGTVAPVAVAAWLVELSAIHHTRRAFENLMDPAGYSWYGVLVYLAVGGIIVAAVESRTLAASLLGGAQVRRPITVRQALARSRMSFWWAVIASLIVGVPVGLAQAALNEILVATLGPQTDLSIVTTTLIAALVGAPFAYLLAGIVLGDVGPIVATRRSFRVFRARKLAAVIVAVFETLAVLLVVLGLFAGLDIVLRVFDALGVGLDSGPAGIALVTTGIVILTFAFGTLVYTALAISIAPQVVMFVGLTHATFGLDHVRPGGRRDPGVDRPGERRFRWLTWPMRIGIALGLLALTSLVVVLLG